MARYTLASASLMLNPGDAFCRTSIPGKVTRVTALDLQKAGMVLGIAITQVNPGNSFTDGATSGDCVAASILGNPPPANPTGAWAVINPSTARVKWTTTLKGGDAVIGILDSGHNLHIQPRPICGYTGYEEVWDLTLPEHGFVGDGVTDNSDRADALGARLAASGKGVTLYLPPGVYLISRTWGQGASAFTMGCRLIGYNQHGQFTSADDKIATTTIVFTGSEAAIRTASITAFNTSALHANQENLSEIGYIRLVSTNHTGFIGNSRPIPVDGPLGASPTLTLYGTPDRTFVLKVRINTGGLLSSGTVAGDYSLDGGLHWFPIVNTAGKPFLPTEGTPAGAMRLNGKNGASPADDVPGTGMFLQFPAGKYVAGDTYSPATIQCTIANIGIEVLGSARCWIHDCWIGGFKNGISFDGAESCSYDRITFSAGGVYSTSGYAEIAVWHEDDSACCVRVGEWKFNGTATNGIYGRSCHFFGALSLLIRGGLDTAVTDSVCENQSGGIAYIQGGELVRFSNVYCGDPAIKDVFTIGHSYGKTNAFIGLHLDNIYTTTNGVGARLVNAKGGVSANAVTVTSGSHTQTAGAPDIIGGNAGVSGVSVDRAVFQWTPAATPLMSTFMGRTQGTTINHLMSPRGQLSIGLQSFGKQIVLHPQNNREFMQHTWKATNYHSWNYRIYSTSSDAFPCSNDRAGVSEKVHISKGDAATNICALFTETGHAGQCTFIANAINHANSANNVAFRLEGRYHNTGGVVVIDSAIVSKWEGDIAHFAEPAVIVSGANLVVTIKPFGTYLSEDWAVTGELHSVGS